MSNPTPTPASNPTRYNRLDLQGSSNVLAALAAMASVAAINKDTQVYEIIVTGDQLSVFSNNAVLSDTAAQSQSAARAAASPPTEPVNEEPKSIRRNKEEMEADLTVEQARERRELGISVDEYLARDSDANDTTPLSTDAPVEVDTTPPPKTEEQKLAEQPGMSTPPTGDTTIAPDPVTSEALLTEMRETVGILIQEGKQDQIAVYTEKLGVPKLSAADPTLYPQIVAYLKGLTNAASADLV